MGTPPPYPPPYPQQPQYPQYPQYPGYPAQPPSPNGDRAISIVVLVLTGLLLVAAAFMGVLVLAFLDYCPPESCSVEGAVVSVATAVGIAVLVGIAGLVITLARLRRRLKAWPVALGALGICVLVLIGGAVAFSAAVG